MLYDPQRALELLRLGSEKESAEFREDQEQAIRHIVENELSRSLIIQRTGWGKSYVYFIATKLLRENGGGLVLLVSPLLSLMRNQRKAAARMGIRAESMDSSNKNDWERIESALKNNEIDILLISPERLNNEHFRDDVLPKIAEDISLLVIDEAHCISDWGHDFRPDYRRIKRLLNTLPTIRLLATTATANERVMDDLKAVLGPDLRVIRGNLNRPSLILQSINLPNRSQRLAWLAEQVPQITGCGIIYTLTVRDAEQVAAWLRSEGVDAKAYSGKMEGNEREALEDALMNNEVKALVATTALGMGFDHPTLSFVIHYQSPGSAIAYYQQVGRAGRALPEAYGVLLSGAEDADINDFFIDNAFPTQYEVKQVLDALEENKEGLSTQEMPRKVNVREGRIRQTVNLLSLEDPPALVKEETKWKLTTTKFSDDFWQRVERLTEIRHEEQKQMQKYVTLPPGEHMHFLLSALDHQPSGTQPSNISPPSSTLSTVVSEPLLERATKFLRRTHLPIEPRKMWPMSGLLQDGMREKIDPENQAKRGKALCVWKDPTWGDLVYRGKYTDKRFSDDLVVECKKLVEAWAPDPAPTWITCIPSLKRPKLVPDFALRLAEALGLPFYTALIKNQNNSGEQKKMHNSAQQALNIANSLELSSDSRLPTGPVLLVDDMIDSGWTITVAAWLLTTKADVSAVWPLALAVTSKGRSS